MNDQLLMENYLLIIKSTVEVYVHGTLESSNKDIRDILNQGLDETLKHQQRIYKEMEKNNWYNVSNVDSNTIKQILIKVCNN